MGRGAGSPRIKAMRHTGLQAKQPLHHRSPFMAMGASEVTILQMMNQPVSHFVRHDLSEKGLTVLGIKYRVEAQSTAPKVRLAGTLATQITPHLGLG